MALVAGAIVLSRAQHEPEAAVAVAWMGCAYAALAGLMLVLRQDGDFFGLPVAAPGRCPGRRADLRDRPR